jgi:hypothetical protein
MVAKDDGATAEDAAEGPPVAMPAGVARWLGAVGGLVRACPPQDVMGQTIDITAIAKVPQVHHVSQDGDVFRPKMKGLAFQVHLPLTWLLHDDASWAAKTPVSIRELEDVLAVRLRGSEKPVEVWVLRGPVNPILSPLHGHKIPARRGAHQRVPLATGALYGGGLYPPEAGGGHLPAEIVSLTSHASPPQERMSTDAGRRNAVAKGLAFRYD